MSLFAGLDVGFGRVLCVRERQTGELMTMKRVRPNDTYALHVSERRALAHPFVVALLDGFDEGSDRVLLFEYCSGPLFARLLKDDPVVSQNGSLYFAQLVLALEYLHAQGIIHRDVKPENVLMDDEGFLKLGDLGLAKREGHSDNRLCGTMAYMPPEMILSQTSNAASDWWSAGICLYELLTGTLPFGGPDTPPAELMSCIVFGACDFPDDLSEDAKELISQLLVKEPENRMADGELIKAHPFFEGIDWDQLMAKQIQLPYLSEESKMLSSHCLGLTPSISLDMQQLNELADTQA